jgi:hypothetical protein
MSHDVKCQELAQLFLSEATKERGVIYDAAIEQLAEDIQNAAEDFLNSRLCEKCHTIMTAKQAIHSECPTCRGA